MFENLVKQEVSTLLVNDIKNNTLPGSILFAGSESSGKLTAALELARIMSCTRPNKAAWNCACPSCLQHKSLVCSNLLLLGPRNCFLEISAAKETFLNAYKENASFLVATRYLFLRSIRKLLLRFSSILWQGDDKINKIGAIVEVINEDLEQLDFPRELLPFEQTKELCDKLCEKAQELENSFLPDSISINQIRNMEQWAHIKSEEGKKTIIIENADRMQTSVRNALLKILEEPPADCLFILLTTRRNAVMPTILSRVRTYNFKTRTLSEQNEVISRVFHNDLFNGSINEYLLTFLPVSFSEIQQIAADFYRTIASSNIPNVAQTVKNCANFEPRIELRIFLETIALCQKPLLTNPNGSEAAAESVKVLRQCWENVTLFNQSPVSALEILVKDLSKINVMNDRIFSKI